MDDFFFVVSKLIWYVAKPANFLLLGLWAGLILTWIE